MRNARGRGLAGAQGALLALLVAACGEDVASNHRPATSTGGSAPETGGRTGSAGGTDALGGTAAGGAGGAALVPGPARYDPTLPRSPLTRDVARHLAEVAARQTRHEDVFMKVGDSATVSRNLLACFAGVPESPYVLDLATHEDLLPTIERFRGGDAAGSTPFNRQTLAAEIGKTAGWAISGNPAPVDSETAALDPRFAFVSFGTNDMGMAATHREALFPFYESMSALLDELEQGGIVPLVSGLPPRTDSADAARWVPTYDALTRGLAEARQVPYLSLYLLTRSLPDQGLVSDGVHGNALLDGGGFQPCIFTAAGLEYGYNARNLASLELLHRVEQVVSGGGAAPDPAPPGYRGAGTPADPFVIDRLPFTHAGSTLDAPSRAIDVYEACSDADESGPEIYYELVLDAPTPVRFLVFDRGDVDVDLHLLGAAPSGTSCLLRHDRYLERALAAGTHHVTVDTYAGGGSERAGAYLFVVVACEPGDPDCG